MHYQMQIHCTVLEPVQICLCPSEGMDDCTGLQQSSSAVHQVITSRFSEHSPPLLDISCSILESLCLILFSSICLISARCHLCVVSVFSLYCCLLALHLVIEATNSSISLESFISQSSLNRFNLIFSCI